MACSSVYFNHNTENSFNIAYSISIIDFPFENNVLTVGKGK
jgi:hypothetical protein